MRRFVPLLAVALLLALVPGSAGAQPADPILSGRLLTPAGAPATGLAVQLVRQKGIGEQLFGAFTSLFVIAIGLGLPLLDCLEEQPSLPICEGDEQLAVRVGADGHWRAAVPDGPGNYAVTVLGIADERLHLVAAAGVDQDRALPDLRLWSPAAAAVAEAGDVRFGVDPMPEAPGWADEPPSYGVELRPDREDAPRGTPVVSGTRATVDGRLLEDAPGTAAFTASGAVGDVGVAWYTAPFRYPAPSGAPLSRGRPCDLGVPDGKPLSVRACWTGDGRVQPLTSARGDADPLGRPLQCRPESSADVPEGFTPGGGLLCSRPPVAAVKVDLGQVRPVGLVVVRGCPGRCLVEASTDGSTWTPPVVVRGDRSTPSDVDEDVRAELDEGTTGRYVRVRSDGAPSRSEVPELFVPEGMTPLGPQQAAAVVAARENPTGDLVALQEVSVWAPRPTAPSDAAPAALPGAPGPDALPGEALPADEVERPPGLLVLLALALVVVAAAAVGNEADRRRRRPAHPSTWAYDPWRAPPRA